MKFDALNQKIREDKSFAESAFQKFHRYEEEASLRTNEAELIKLHNYLKKTQQVSG